MRIRGLTTGMIGQPAKVPRYVYLSVQYPGILSCTIVTARALSPFHSIPLHNDPQRPRNNHPQPSPQPPKHLPPTTALRHRPNPPPNFHLDLSSHARLQQHQAPSSQNIHPTIHRQQNHFTARRLFNRFQRNG